MNKERLIKLKNLILEKPELFKRPELDETKTICIPGWMDKVSDDE